MRDRKRHTGFTKARLCAFIGLFATSLWAGPALAADAASTLVRCVDCEEVETWLKSATIEHMEWLIDNQNRDPDLWSDDDWDDDGGWDGGGDDWSGDDADGVDQAECCGCNDPLIKDKKGSGDDDGEAGGDDASYADDDAADDDWSDDDVGDDYSDDDYSDDEADDDDDASHSDTNIQEEGVDEADLMKTDGEYLYLVSGGWFLIFDADPVWALDELSRTDMTGRPEEMYVSGDRAVIFSVLSPATLPDYVWPLVPRDQLDDVITKITVMAIADKHNPKMIREIYVEGPSVGNRRIDGIVHVVFGGEKGGPSIRTELSPIGYGSWEAYEAALEELKAINRDIINDAPVEEWVPRRFDVDLTDGIEVTSGHLTECGDTYHPSESMGSSILTVLSLDMELAEYETSSLSIIATGLILYASPSNLYVAGSIAGARTMWSQDPNFLPATSHVHRFDIGTQPGSALYAASGTVDGFVLNQFSMSEYNGDLRVATTTGTSLADAANSVQVLRQVGASLDIVGRADDIAPGEELYAARFMGPIGYLVTFPTPDEDPWEDPWDDWGDDDWWDGGGNDDPLFTIDLTDPEAPVVRGELIVPGFSTYIHPFDAGHLMTIGESGDENGADGGVALSMFDVTNLDDPQRIHHVDLGDWDVSSDAKFDHHAFLFWPDTGLLAIPLEMADWFGSPFSGVFAFRVDVPTGFEFLADIGHTEFTGEAGSDDYGGLSVPRRSVVIESYLITISDLGIVVTHMPTWVDLLRVDLPWKNRTLEGR